MQQVEASSQQSAKRYTVTGVVQGVGFRPFVFRLATELGLVGLVGNDSSSVFIEATGSESALQEFGSRLRSDAPPLATVAQIEAIDLLAVRSSTASHTAGFRIVASEVAVGDRTLIPPDVAVCDDCRRELFDPADRRYGHPFITCTNCGPRLSIIADLPYDRPNTTMASFPLCATCEAEYNDPNDRRYHAQPIGCHDCGPRLTFRLRIGESVPAGPAPGGPVPGGPALGDAILAATAALQRGEVVAVKGIGGYHLVCDAMNLDAVATLRRRKDRPDKPFAILVADLDHARQFAELAPIEAAALQSAAAPIVLARRTPSSALPDLVAPGNPLVGVMLPYAPVQHLLMAANRTPLVVTSANAAGEPLAFEQATIAELHHLYDALLDHDRDIRVPVDDSVVRLVGGEMVPIRRARGYAPVPVELPGSDRHVLAAGGELKNTFCLAGGGHAWVSQHIGDMENLTTLQAFESMVGEYSSMYQVEPEVVAVDAHPGYLSSKWARRTAEAPVLEVQHHHAHVAAVMAEHQLDPERPVLGFAFDGTGYGTDGTIWGGEVLIATAAQFQRVAHLKAVQLPGGDSAIQNPHRIALTHLLEAGIAWEDDLAPVQQLTGGERALLAQQLARSIACVPTTSMGRLFDAVASLLDIRHRISYEAQAAIELEILAQSGRPSDTSYRLAVDQGVIDPGPMLRDIVADIRSDRPAADIALRFHQAIAESVAEVALQHDLDTVVLSGGVFQNALLHRLCIERLTDGQVPEGRRVLTHKRVPANDGGLSLGQAFVAAHTPTPTLKFH